jgi:chromosome segregation ATPase
MKIASLLNEKNSNTVKGLPIDKDLIHKARMKYPGYDGQQALTLYIADQMRDQEQTDTTQNKLIDTQKRENERLRGAVQSLGQELQDFEQQSIETDREVARLKQLSGALTAGGAQTQQKAKVSADDLEKLQKDLEMLKTKPGMDPEKFKNIELQIKQIANNPSVDDKDLAKVNSLIITLNNQKTVGDELYKKLEDQLRKTQSDLDKKEGRFAKYIEKKKGEVGSMQQTHAGEIQKYAELIKGYQKEIDNFGNELKKMDKEKGIILQLRAGVQQDAEEINNMKSEISAKLDLINDVTRKLAVNPAQAQNDSSIEPRSGPGPNADVLGQLAKGPESEKNITKGAENMLGRKLAEGVQEKPIKPLQKYGNKEYDEWLSKHLPALVRIFKNKYWRDLEKADRQYSDEQIHYIVEKYTPMLYNLADEDTPLTAEQVNNWLVVVKSKLWEEPVRNQLDLFTEGLDKTYARMLDNLIGLDYIKKG